MHHPLAAEDGQNFKFCTKPSCRMPRGPRSPALSSALSSSTEHWCGHLMEAARRRTTDSSNRRGGANCQPTCHRRRRRRRAAAAAADHLQGKANTKRTSLFFTQRQFVTHLTLSPSLDDDVAVRYPWTRTGRAESRAAPTPQSSQSILRGATALTALVALERRGQRGSRD